MGSRSEIPLKSKKLLLKMWPFWDSKGLVKKHQAQQESNKNRPETWNEHFSRPWKLMLGRWVMSFLLGCQAFRCHVSFRECFIDFARNWDVYFPFRMPKSWRKTCDSVGFPTTRKVIWRIPAPWNIWLKDTTKIWEVGWASPFGASCIFTGDGMPGVKGSIQLPRKLKVFSWVSLCHPFCTRHHQCTPEHRF